MARDFKTKPTVNGAPLAMELPPGMMMPFAGPAAPDGYFICDGSTRNRTSYAALYNALGGASSPWGQGDGVNTFNLPDMRGRAPIGVGQGTGLTNRNRGDRVGAETHKLTADELPPHTHDYNDHIHSVVGRNTGNANTSSIPIGNTSTSASTGGDTPHPNMPPSVAVNFVIKF